MTLRELYYGKGYGYYPTDKGTTHFYIDTYDELFAPLQDSKINVLEVGVSEGGSVRLWSEYFTNAKIYGYDIMNTARENIFTDNVSYVIKDVNLIKFDEFENIPLSIAIDDGSHVLNDQLFFVKVIYPQMIDGGLLIIEDIQDIDNQKKDFETLGIPFEIIDLRPITNRYDDVLLLFRK